MEIAVIRLVDRMGSVPSGRARATKLREEILRDLKRDGTVVVDLGGVVAMSPSFGDELFAKLATEIEQGRVRFDNVDPGVQSLARFVQAGRSRHME